MVGEVRMFSSITVGATSVVGSETFSLPVSKLSSSSGKLGVADECSAVGESARIEFSASIARFTSEAVQPAVS